MSKRAARASLRDSKSTPISSADTWCSKSALLFTKSIGFRQKIWTSSIARRFVAAASELEQVLLCCYSGEDVATYKRALRMEVGGAPGDRKPTDGSK
jgi:hypothetical protein